MHVRDSTTSLLSVFNALNHSKYDANLLLYSKNGALQPMMNGSGQKYDYRKRS